MRSAALLEAQERGLNPFPVLRVTWQARGLSLGAGLYSPTGRATAAGPVTMVTQPGSWSPIRYGSGIEKGALETPLAQVGIVDVAGELWDMLETYKPHGSAAAIDIAAPDLVAADWEARFRGVVDDWQRNGPYTLLLMKTDDSALRTPIPAGTFSRPEWRGAADGTIFGTALPLVFGVHDAFLITARGMMPAVNIRYDKDLGYWWAVSANNLKAIRRIYYDGLPQDGAGWTTLRGVYGGQLLTIISIAEGYQPEKGAVVSCDCEGPDANGLTVGASLTNPVRTLRVVLEEWTYRKPPLGTWRGAASIIDDASWTAVAAWLDARGYDSARRFGGDQNPQTAAEVIASFLDQHPWARIHWTPLGTLELVIFDPDDIDPDAAAWFEIDKHHETGLVAQAPGDRREVYSHVKVPFLWSSSESKFLSAITASDLGTQADTLPLEVPNEWTQARFSEE